MDTRSTLETIQDSFLDLIDSAVEYTPKVVAALLLLVIGIIVARFASKLLGRFVDAIESNKEVMKMAKRMNVNVLDISDIVTLISKWAILLIFISAAVDVLGVSVLSNTFDDLLAFVPNIFAAAAIAGLSFIAGNIVKDVVHESAKQAKISAATFLSSAARVAVLVFGLPLAAAQLGLDLSIINNNLTVIVGGVMLALGLAFGLGGRDTAGKIVDDLYNNWKK